VHLSRSDVVLVTGGASGLGEATVRAVLAGEASAVIVDLPASRGAELADELGERVLFAPADVRDEDQVQAAVDAAAGLGTLRVAVNCAGVATPGRVIGKRGVLPLEAFRTVIDINLVGTFNVLRLAAAEMINNAPVDGDRGVVVMTASVAAFDGQIGQAAYSASKGGVLAMALPIARDLMNDGVRVNTILPGVFKTPMVAMMPENVQDALGAQVPFPKRLGQADEYARLALFLIENVYMNAASVRLDGGIRMAPR
jgi:NAD(P)-dependent dehydrogenase (short-subunit alcohol dehydrogenase family)